ncbi:MAG: Gfo/Idh/MocA family oxidoreductase [Dehalococcoidia bacterium]|nr:Gfo/Idh/MocA family oxidoreductase [Dehalococcoidia bacterium]
MMQRVVDLYRPLAERARAAGVTLALENCGATPPEIFAFLDALSMPNVKLAWDAWFWWDWITGLGQAEDPETSAESLIACVKRAACVHAKGRGVVDSMRMEKNGAPTPSVPYGRVLASLHAAGFQGPISAETGYRKRSGEVTANESVEIVGASYQVIDTLRREWPTAAPQTLYEAARPAARKMARPYENDPVRYVVVGLGKGHQRSVEVTETPGAKLIGVCDIREDRARKSAKVCGVPYELDVRRWLDNKDVEAVYVLTPTGRHAEVASMALEAGKHVLCTKPMEVSLAACDEMIRLAERNNVLLGVDFQKRYETPITSLRAAVADGWFGRLLGGKLSLQCYRDAAYFLENGGWRGTKRWDGGGVISNQAVHSIDQAAYTIGIPAKVRCDIWTQTHDIEAEDLAVGTWLYDSGLVVSFFGTTSYTQQTWSPDVALYGSEGAFNLTYGGIWERPDQHWFRDGVWTDKAPKVVEPEYANATDNFSAAIRLGVPITCDGRDGRRTQAIIDAMFRSAYSGGGWVDVTPEYQG